MADEKTKTGLAVGVGAAAGTVAGILATRQARAAPLPGTVTLDEAVMALLQALVESSYQTLQVLHDILAKGFNVGVVPNTETERTVAVVCVVANIPYQLPSLLVPDDMSLALKADPGNAIGALIRIGTSPAECVNPNSSWPLILNESMTWRIKDSARLWVSSNVPAQTIIISAEQRS